MTGKLILVVAPSGSGKDTLMRHVRATFPELKYFVSHTTRTPRAGEKNGESYHFLSRAEFEAMAQEGGFLEWAEYAGNLYGTSKDHLVGALERGEVLITDMEIQGVHQVLGTLPRENVATVFIDAGGWDVLKRRIEKRGKISSEELEERYERYQKEVLFKEKSDHVVLNPDGGVEKAKEEFSRIVEAIIKSIPR